MAKSINEQCQFIKDWFLTTDLVTITVETCKYKELGLKYDNEFYKKDIKHLKAAKKRLSNPAVQRVIKTKKTV